MINVKTKGKFCNLNPEEILYIESSKHDITIYTHKEEQKCRMKLCDFFGSLPDYFIRVHQSYAINARYIKDFDTCGATLLDGRMVPVSRRRRKEAEKAWGNLRGKGING